MTTDHNEAMRLADRISPETDWYEFDQVTWCNEAAALIRKQAERIAELESDYQRLMEKHNALHVNALKHRNERDTLRAEVERLKPNAERYEWLRASHWSSAPVCCVLEPKANVRLGATCPSGDQLDTAIDTARKATQ